MVQLIFLMTLARWRLEVATVFVTGRRFGSTGVRIFVPIAHNYKQPFGTFALSMKLDYPNVDGRIKTKEESFHFLAFIHLFCSDLRGLSVQHIIHAVL